MADNVAITAGSGTSIAADDISSVFYQRVKVNWGPDGTANEADTATGKPLPVQPRSPTGEDLSRALWAPGTSNSGLLATAFNLMTTELDSRANAAVIISSVGGSSGKFTNADTAQAKWGEIYLTLGTVTTMTAGGALSGWFLTSYDSGTTYESTTVVPPRAPDFIVPLDATTGNKVYKASGLVRIPALQFKVMIQNNSGQSFTASGNTLKLAPIAELM
jgi:hypothetical protein